MPADTVGIAGASPADSLVAQWREAADSLVAERLAAADSLLVSADSLLTVEAADSTVTGIDSAGDELEDSGSKKKKRSKKVDDVSVPDTLKAGQIRLEDGTVTYTDGFLDSLNVKKKNTINDYSMIGIQYGVGLNQMSWNPSMEQKSIFTPINVGVMWTRYGKIFGYMPFFGIQAGVFYTREGYELKDGYHVSGATKATMNIVEVPMLAHCHFDFWKMKLLVNIGIYGSYRLDIERSSDYSTLPPAFANSFLSTDHRFDYGIKAGGGFGFIFDPIEIHFTVSYKYGFGNLYDADYYSQTYYRFAHVSNLILSVGVHYQLTKRTGKTTHQLKKEARALYNEQINGSDDEF